MLFADQCGYSMNIHASSAKDAKPFAVERGKSYPKLQTTNLRFSMGHDLKRGNPAQGGIRAAR
jgi:hypothetical protein